MKAAMLHRVHGCATAIAATGRHRRPRRHRRVMPPRHRNPGHQDPTGPSASSPACGTNRIDVRKIDLSKKGGRTGGSCGRQYLGQNGGGVNCQTVGIVDQGPRD